MEVTPPPCALMPSPFSPQTPPMQGPSHTRTPPPADDRYCIDNGAMIAWPGLLAFQCGLATELADSSCTQVSVCGGADGCSPFSAVS